MHSNNILNDQYARGADLVAWRDSAEDTYAEHTAFLTEAIATLRGAPGSAAKYSRDLFQAELQRVQAVLATPRNVERERAAFAQAIEARNAIPHEVQDEAEAEALRRAEIKIADRDAQEARRAFVDAAKAATLPPLGGWSRDMRRRYMAEAKTATRDLVAARIKHGPIDHRYANQAADKARFQGQSSNMTKLLPFFALTEVEYRGAGEVDATELFELRWRVAIAGLRASGEMAPAAAE